MSYRTGASRWPLATLLALCVGACGGAPDADQELDTLRSWTASVRLATEELGTGATTPTFAADLRAKAASALDDERRAAAAAPWSAADMMKVHAAADSLEGAIVRLDRLAAR